MATRREVLDEMMAAARAAGDAREALLAADRITSVVTTDTNHVVCVDRSDHDAAYADALMVVQAAERYTRAKAALDALPR